MQPKGTRRQRRELLLGLAALGLSGGRAWGAGTPFKQGVTRMIFGQRPLEECCRIAAQLGAQGFDFIDDPKDWATVRRHGLTMSMLRADYGGGVSIGRSPPGPPGWGAIGLPAAQGQYQEAILELIDTAARQGFPNVFLSAGTRDQVSYEQGAANAIAFLRRVRPHAEARGVTLCMELLNSYGIQGPKNSLFDHARWGFGVVREVGSPRIKVLYDIWHAQLMDGNIVQTLRDNIAWVGHIHVGAVPARHELFRDDELNYGYIGRVIGELGFTGFVTHEWSASPNSDVTEDLRRSMALISGQSGG